MDRTDPYVQIPAMAASLSKGACALVYTMDRTDPYVQLPAYVYYNGCRLTYALSSVCPRFYIHT